MWHTDLNSGEGTAVACTGNRPLCITRACLALRGMSQCGQRAHSDLEQNFPAGVPWLARGLDALVDRRG